MADVFISYSRRDLAFARILHQAFKDNEFETWIDWQDIPPSTDWLAEVYAAIEQANTFVFVISQASVGSEICRLEIAHAVENNKRLIPVVIDEVEPQKVTPELAALNWLFFSNEDEFSQSFQDLIDAIETDYAWVKEHTRLQVRALEWQRKERETGFLLRGRDLSEAEMWLIQAADKKSQPTNLHAEYILASRQAETRRWRLTVGGVVASILLIMAALLAAVVIQTNARQQAEAALQVALSRQLAGASTQQLNRDLSLSLLLSLEAMDILDTVEARSSLLDGLNRSVYIEALLHGQETSVTSIAFSPDGKLVATGSCSKEEYIGFSSICTQGSIHLWDVEGYRLLERWDTGLLNALALAFSPDGNLLAVGGSYEREGLFMASSQGAVELWDVATRQQSGPPLLGRRHEGSANDYQVEHIAFSPDGRWLAVSSGNITLWDLAGRRMVAEPSLGWWITGLAFSPDGEWLAVSSSSEDAIGLWPVTAEGLGADPVRWDIESPRGVAFHPDGAMLAVTHKDGSIGFRELSSGELLEAPLEAAAGDGVSLSFSADGHYLASRGKDNHITVWEVASPEKAYRTKVAFELQSAATRMAFSRNGYRLVTGSSSEIILWNLERRHPLITAELAGTAALSLAFSPDGSVLAATHRAGINLWELPEGKELPGLPGQPSDWMQTSLAFSPDGKTLIIGDEMFDHNVTLWDLDRGQPIALSLEGHQSAVWSVAFSPTDEIAASGSLDGTIIFWDPKTGTPLSPPLSDRHGYEDLLWKGGEAENAVRSITFTPDGRVLVTGRRSGDILLWDVVQQQPHGEGWTAHRGGVNAVVVSPDGRIIASVGDDFLIRLWDMETHALLRELVGHTEPVSGLSFSADGTLLASGGGLVGGGLRLWDVSAGRALGQVQPELADNVDGIAFGPNGQILATGSDRILLWDLSTEMWLQQARQIANRDLTPEERRLYLDDTR